MTYPEIKKLASKLRKSQTPEEKLLWANLRGRKLMGRKFLRQHPIIYESNKNEHFFYIPDFYCAEEKLVVELDGEIHDFRKSQDERRDLILESRQLRVLRIKNEEIIDITKVLARIKSLFKS